MATNNPSTRTSPPPMLDVLKKLIRGSMSDLRCCLPANVTAVDAAMGTVDVAIAIKYKRSTGEYADYPVLSALPAIVLQGGGVAAHFPVQKGDQCLVFFADRAMDAWKGAGDPQPLPYNRMHDLSDGFALVGVNSFNKVLDLFLDADEGGIATAAAKVAIDRTTETITLENDAAKVVLNNTSGKIKVENQAQSLLAVLTDLNTALTSLLTTLTTLNGTIAAESAVIPTAAAGATAASASIVTIQTAINAVQSDLAGLLE